MDNTYMVTVKATDGTYMDTHDVTVMVTDVGELGMLAGESAITYMENGTDAVGTYTADGPVAASWSVEGDDMGAFSIGGSSGELMFASPPDFEAPADMGMDNIYQVTVKAEAGGEMATQDVTVMVTNVDEVETVTLSATRPEVGMEITAELSDDGDEILGVVTWQWASSDAMDGTYTDIEGRHVGRLHAGGSGRDNVPAGNGDVHRHAWFRQERNGGIGEHGRGRRPDDIGHG